MRVVLDGVFNHTGRGFLPFHHVLETGPSSPYRHWFHLDDARLDARPAAARLSAARDATERARLRGLVGPAGAAQAQHRRPRGPRVPDRASPSTGSGSGSTAGGWTSRRDRRRAVLAGVPAALPGGPSRRLPRRRDLAGRARVAPRRPLRRADELPARRGDPRLRREADLDMAIVAPHHEYRLWRPAARRTGLRGQGDGAGRTAYDPRRRRRPAQPARLARRAAAAHGARRRRAGRPAGDAAPGDAARRAVRSTTATRSAWPAATIPSAARGFPWDEARWEPGLRESVRALLRLRRAEPALRDATAPDRRRRRPAVAFERGDGCVALRRRGQPGRRGRPARSRLRGRRRWRAARADRRCPGFGGVAGTRDRRRRRDRSTCRPAQVPSCASAESPRHGFRSYSAACGRPPDRTRGRAHRAAGPHPRCRGQDPAGARRPWVPSGGATCCCSMAPKGSVPGSSTELGARVTFAATNGSRGSTRPTTRPTSWSACGPRSAAISGRQSARGGPGPAPRRPPAGRSIDYGRDDVSRLRGDLPEYGLLSRRDGPFLRGGFRVRVVHCFWTFESHRRGGARSSRRPSARREPRWRPRMKRPRLSYNVAVYHRDVRRRRRDRREPSRHARPGIVFLAVALIGSVAVRALRGHRPRPVADPAAGGRLRGRSGSSSSPSPPTRCGRPGGPASTAGAGRALGARRSAAGSRRSSGPVCVAGAIILFLLAPAADVLRACRHDGPHRGPSGRLRPSRAPIV